MNKTAIDVTRVTTAVIYLPYESNLDCLAKKNKYGGVKQSRERISALCK